MTAAPEGAGSTSPRRVLIAVESLRRGGAETLIVTTLKHLDRQRFHPVVVSLFGPNPLAVPIRNLNIVVHELGLRGPRDLVRAIRGIRSILRDDRIDVLHTHLFTANVAGRVAAVGLCPVVTTLHNPDYGQEGGIFGMRRAVDGVTARLFQPRFLAVSRDVESDYRRSLAIDDVQVLYNYMDIDAFGARVRRQSKAEALDRLGLDERHRVILHAGRFHPQKDQTSLVKAFAIVAEAEPLARLVLAGEGPDREAIEELVRSLNLEELVIFPGNVADVAGLLAAADVFAFPSRYEAFGIALLEAMAAGVAVVASDVGGIREVATEGAAVLVPVANPEVLAEALVSVLGDPGLRVRIGEAGRLRASAFDVSRVLPELEAVYAST